ncbi:MAG: rhodanese-like domain-containing protein [Gammaproteobacteria bacterium]|nr:rhodanese-like domain-containing protein [Gammaproteobacteria bacterium]
MAQIIEFASNHPFLVGLAFGLTILMIVNEMRLLGRKGLDVSPAETVALMNNGATIVDVRSLELFRAGHILNAVHIAFDDLEERASKVLKPHKDSVIVVYDDLGLQGAKAGGILRQLNFKAASLKGGLAAWKRENLPVEKGK